jgi:hypothetical protein
MICGRRIPSIDCWKFFQIELRFTERFACFAANAYMESGWNGTMDIHGVVDDGLQQERPFG